MLPPPGPLFYFRFVLRVITAEIELAQAGRKYAQEALEQPAFLRAHWKRMLAACRRQIQ